MSQSLTALEAKRSGILQQFVLGLIESYFHYSTLAGSSLGSLGTRLNTLTPGAGQAYALRTAMALKEVVIPGFQVHV